MLIIRKVLYIINLICALVLVLSYTSAFIPQDIFSSLSLLGYLYPFMLAINVVFIIVWLIIKPRHILVSAIAIAIRFDYITRLINVSSQEQDGELKVLTYNVHDFIHGKDNEDYLGEAALCDSILNYISSLNADVVCLQDYDVNIKWNNGFHSQMISSLGFNHFYYYYLKSENVSNCAVYSKYPITDAGSALPEDERKQYLIYTDIKTPNQTVRVYNIHLKSYMLGPKEKEDYKEILKGNVTDSASKNLISKILEANKIRAKQIREMIPQMECQQKAIIICGDFNDHPFSNTYTKFAASFCDSFVSKGNGIGRTYNGIFPAYRIDYIWYDKSRLECTGYESQALDFSDHYPVVSTFKIKRQ